MRTLLLNHLLLNWDGCLDLSPLEAAGGELTIRDATSTVELVQVAEGYDALISKEMSIPEEVIEALPDSVQLICEAGTGYNNIAWGSDAAKSRGLVVCNVPGYSTPSVAQLAMSYVLGIASGTLGFVDRAARGDRSDFGGAPATPTEVAGKTLGVVGPGAIGEQVARRALAFGMNVLTYGRRVREWKSTAMRAVETLEELLAESDYVSLHCPLVEDGPHATRHLIRASTLRLMKSGAWLLNTSRGGLIDQADLIKALKEGRIAGAALDVQDPEPPSVKDPLWEAPRTYLTPHVGWKTVEARQRLIQEVAQVLDAFKRREPIHVVTRGS